MKRDNPSVFGIAAVAVATLLAVVGAVLLVLWANDVHQDRRHVVIVNSQTPVFRGAGDGCEVNKPAALVKSGTVLRVRRIRYWKDCATIDVMLPNHHSGYVVYGVGNFSVRPPLN